VSSNALKADERPREDGHFGGHRVRNEHLIDCALTKISACEVRDGAPNQYRASSGFEYSEDLVNVIRVFSVPGNRF
jgi:hypothetical protein